MVRSLWSVRGQVWPTGGGLWSMRGELRLMVKQLQTGGRATTPMRDYSPAIAIVPREIAPPATAPHRISKRSVRSTWRSPIAVDRRSRYRPGTSPAVGTISFELAVRFFANAAGSRARD